MSVKGGKVPQGYKSPIYTELTNEILNEIDDCIYNEVRLVVDVDKDELFKALAYDREQFNKGYTIGYLEGYEDGMKAVTEQVSRLIKEMEEEV